MNANDQRPPATAGVNTAPPPAITAYAKLSFPGADQMTDFIGSVIDLAYTSEFHAFLERGRRPVLFASLLPHRGEARVYVSEGVLELVALNGKHPWVAETTTLENLPFGLSMILGHKVDSAEYARTHS